MKDTILSIIRHILTFAGGLAVAKGIGSEETWVALAGSVPTTVGLIWGAFDEWKASKATK